MKKGEKRLKLTLEKIDINYPNPQKSNLILASKTISDLLKGITDRLFTASEILKVYTKTAIQLHYKFNFITEILYDDACSQADLVDLHFNTNKTLIGSLHAVPIVLKDDIDIKGYDSSLGCRCGTFRPKYMDSTIITILKLQGAIPFIKTNVSFHLLMAESNNTVFGQSINPLYQYISTGGSSGGLASCLSSFGSTSLVGVGSDRVGGLRIPSQNCGLYSLKPTSLRFPSATINNRSLCWATLPAVLGPVAQNLKDLKIIFQTLINSNPEFIDPSVTPIKFDDTSYKNIQEKKLRIGYFSHDGFFRSTPPCSRAVAKVVTELRAAGHECVEISIPNFTDAILLLCQLLTINLSAGCTSLTDLQELDLSQPIIPIIMLLKAPRRVIGKFFEKILDDQTAAKIIRSIGLGPGFSGSKDASFTNKIFFWWWYALKWFFGLGDRKDTRDGIDILKLISEKEDYQKNFNEIWSENGDIDAIVCPVHALPPLPSTSFPYICSGASYSMLFSFLDYPVGIIPNVTHVTPDDRIEDTLSYVHGRDVDESSSVFQHDASTNVFPLRPKHVPSHILPEGVNLMHDDLESNNISGTYTTPPIPPLPQEFFSNQNPVGEEQEPNTNFSVKTSFNLLGILGIEEYNSALQSGVLNGVGVGVQVVCRRYQEEKVLGVMKVIEKLKGKS
ncbi:hypothetical protein HK099_007545 [Clydaea vesicula]|uniref:Amidase domain-containing protein n=1 Tax=Clydaea vesicula TaxID=447962 RepID=A0AAD5U8G0_9FUNG|nr:hypothetical protein HK099_007545 [Clydaea vesicula]